MTHAEIMAEIDRYVTKGVGGYSGWHEQQPIGGDYKPMLQQNRAEWSELMHAVCALSPCQYAIQIGLGIPGGSHWALRQAFERVTTVEIDDHAAAHYREWHPPMPGDWIVVGNSRDGGVMRLIPNEADLLLIDGDHTREGVQADWVNFRPFVRPGGLVVFHDTWKPQPGCEVPAFIGWLAGDPLRTEGAALCRIEGPDPQTRVGLAYYRRAA